MAVDVNKIIKRYSYLYQQQQLFASTWQELAEYLVPRKAIVTVHKSPGQKQTEKLFDSTGIHSSELLAATLNGSLTSSSAKWFTLKMRESELNEIKEVREWLEDCSKRMYLSFSQSNFNSEVYETYIDLVDFGIGALLLEEDEIESAGFNGFRFEALQIGTYVVAEDARGRVNTLFRKFKKGARAAVDEWGDKVGEKIKEKALKNPDLEIEFMHCVYPDPDDKKHFLSLTIAVQEKIVVKESFYEEFPYLVPRWNKTSGEVYGRGPGHTALPDIKTLNKAVEMNLKAWGIEIQPPIAAEDDSIIGDINLTPGGVTWYQRGSKPPVPITLRTNFQITMVNRDDLKKSIRGIFHSDQIETLLATGGPQKTATEVQIKYEIIQQLLGPTLGRIERELLDPLIVRAFNIMYRAGAFAPMPAVLAQTENAHYDIRYESPLARAQRSSDVVAIQRMNSLVAEIAQIAKPDVLDVVDYDREVREVADILGVPAGILRDQDEVDAMRQARTEGLKAEQQKQDMLDMAEGIKKVAPVMKEMEAA